MYPERMKRRENAATNVRLCAKGEGGHDKFPGLDAGKGKGEKERDVGVAT